MVEEVGSIEIAGTINTESMRAGLEQLKSGFNEARESAKSSIGDMERLSGTITGLAGPIAGIGTAIGGTMMGIAALGPYAQPALNQMAVDFDRLSISLSEDLAPAFDSIAGAFGSFVNLAESPTVSSALEGIAATLVIVSDNAKTALDDLNLLFNPPESGIPPRTKEEPFLESLAKDPLGTGLEELGLPLGGALLGSGPLAWMLNKLPGISGVTAGKVFPFLGAGLSWMQNWRDIAFTPELEGGGEDYFGQTIKSMEAMGMTGAAAGSVVPGLGTLTGGAYGLAAGLGWGAGNWLGDVTYEPIGKPYMEAASRGKEIFTGKGIEQGDMTDLFWAQSPLGVLIGGLANIFDPKEGEERTFNVSWDEAGIEAITIPEASIESVKMPKVEIPKATIKEAEIESLKLPEQYRVSSFDNQTGVSDKKLYDWNRNWNRHIFGSG